MMNLHRDAVNMTIVAIDASCKERIALQRKEIMQNFVKVNFREGTANSQFERVEPVDGEIP
jgi:hypothetical protein